MNNDELQIVLGELKRKKKFRDIDLDRFRSVLGAARNEYDSFSFDPAPSLDVIKKKLVFPRSSGTVKEDHKKIFSLRYGVPSLAAGAVAAVIVAVFWFLPFPQQQADRAVCSFSYGDVLLHRGNETLAVNAGMEFLRGDRVVTGERSFADVVVDDTAKIRVQSRTSLLISRILGHETGHPMDLDVNIGRGTVLFSFKKLGKGDHATVRTPTSVAGVRGTSFGVEVHEDRSVRYEVLEGKIRVRRHVDVSDIVADSGGSVVQKQVDRVLEQESVTVSSNQVCAVGGGTGDRLVREVRAAVKRSAAAGAPLNMKVPKGARPAVSTTEEGGTRMFSGLRAISTREKNNKSNTAVIELAVNVFPETAGVKVDGDFRGKGDVAIVTAPGVHTIEVSDRGYLPKTIRQQFTMAANSIAVHLERDSGRFSFRNWAARANSSMLFTVAHAGMLVNVSRSGMIEAVSTERIIWKRNLNSHLTAVPTWDRGRMYCATGNERITALSLSDGRSLWVRKIEGILLFGSAVEPDGDSLFAGTSRGNLYRFTRRGKMVWRTAFDGGIFASPFVSGNTVFVPVQDGNLYKVNRENGKVSGKINTGKIIGSSRIVRGSKLYLANYNGDVICYNHERDTVEWRYATERNVIIATILDGDNLFVINGGGTIYNLTTGGTLRWKTELGSSIKADPVIRGRNMYAVTERVLYLIDTGSGNVKWSYVMANFPATGVTVSGNNLYVGTEKNGIIVLRKD